jgi:archaemetzincin
MQDEASSLRLTLVSTVGVSSEVLLAIADVLVPAFGVNVSVENKPLEIPIDPAAWQSKQLLAPKVLSCLKETHGCLPGRILAIVDCDITVPVMQYVMGHAEMGGKHAVISTARLGVDHLAARAAKLAVHEVGHLFGLVHCDRAACAMFPVLSCHQLDETTTSLCSYCASELLYRRSRRR